MKKLVVTDKGIGIAEMPEWPNSDVTDEWVRQYESAVKQAIASAPLFEDQERVKEIVGSFANTDPLMFSYEMPSGIKKPIHGTYPIPPGFPEYVEVGVCSENVCCGFGESCQNYHTILRFVDKQEQCPHRYVDCKCEPHFCDWVNKDKQEQRNHLVELMKEDEKHGMYEESQEELWAFAIDKICGDKGRHRPQSETIKDLSEVITIKRK